MGSFQCHRQRLRPFNDVGILKSNKTVVALKNDSILEETIDYFESFDCTVPTDGIYEQIPCHSPNFDWIDCNLADLFGIDPNQPDPIIPPQFEVYEARKRPSALFVPELSVVFDIESAPFIPTGGADNQKHHGQHKSKTHNGPPPRNQTTKSSQRDIL